MSFYPKEGLITLHQSENPPITQQITEELNKPGYGEFITEAELTEAIDNIEGVLTTEQSNKLNEILPYNINSNTWPIIPVIKTDGVMEVGYCFDFHNVTNDTIDYKARLYCSDDNTLSVGNMNMTKLNGNNIDSRAWPSIPVINSTGLMHVGKEIKFYQNTINSSVCSFQLNDFRNVTLTDSGYFQATILKASTQLFAGDIQPFHGNDKVIIRRNGFGDTKIAEFNNDRTTLFYGEISTPTFNSSGLLNRINSLEAADEPHGFYYPTASNLVIDLSQGNFRLSYIHTGYDVYYKGTKFNLGGQYPIPLPPLGVVRYIWFTIIDNVLTIQYGDNTGFNVMEQLLVAYVINFGNDFYVVGDERHGMIMDRKTHEYLHRTQGSKYVSGGLLYGYTLNDDIGAVYGVGQTTFYDEDYYKH